MGLIVGIIVAILLVGLFFKLLKLAIIIALVVGGFLVAQNYMGGKRLK